MNCVHCGYDLGTSTSSGRAEINGVCYCYNCLTLLLLEPINNCTICGHEATGTIYDFSMETKETIPLHLCSKHLKKVALHNLCRKDVKYLREKLGEIFFTHDDFYDEHGRALQPV